VVPFSWDKRKKAVENAKMIALNQIATNPPPVDDNMRKVFQRIYQCQHSSTRGPSLEQCKEKLDGIRKKIEDLRQARANYAQSGVANQEKLPKLTPAAQQAFITAKIAEEIAQRVSSTYEFAAASGTADGARDLFVNAANAVVAQYGGPLTVAAGAPGAVVITNPILILSGEHAAAVAAATAFIQSVYATAYNAGNAQTAIGVANGANTFARAAAKVADGALSAQTFFTASPVLNGYAKQIKALERELKETAGQIIESLCNAPNEGGAYSNLTTFSTFYNQMFEQFNLATGDAMRDLDQIAISIGLPSIRDEKRKANKKYQFKQAIKENWKPIAYLTGGEAALGLGVGLAYGLGGLGTLATGGLILAGTAAAVATNAALVSLGYWLMSDDNC